MSNLTPLLEIAKELLKPAGNKGMHVDDIAEKAMKNNQNMYLTAPKFSRKLQAALAANLKIKTPRGFKYEAQRLT